MKHILQRNFNHGNMLSSEKERNRNMKCRKKILLICILALTVGITVAYAVKVYEISFTNNFNTGSVDVRIDQYEITEYGEKLIDSGIVMPNQNVSYIPRVTNLRSDSYVRVKVDIIMDKDIPQPITVKNVYDINKEWVQRGEYFYCTKVLKPEDTSDLFRGFHIPETWQQETASGFTIKVKVDAIQDDYFTPDFNSLSPWGNVEIEQAKAEDNIVYGIAKQIGTSHKLQYTANNGLESETSDLFANFDHFMAGDSYRDALSMQNESDNAIRVYFKTQTVSDDLLEQMKLEIKCNGNKIYSGDLVSKPLYGYEKLTVIKKNQEQDFEFEIKLPESSKNYYSVLKDKVIWKFKVEEIPDNNSSVATGDTQHILLFIIIGITSLGIILTMLIARRKEAKNEENNQDR